MNRLAQYLACGLILFSQASFGGVIFAQDFNALSDAGSRITEGVNQGSSLPNSGSFNNGGPGLSFRTTWSDTRGTGAGPVTATGDASDLVGVNSFSGSNAPDVAANGTAVVSGREHNFIFNDGDGLLTLIFETLNLSRYINRKLSFNYWINHTGYESDDLFQIKLFSGSGLLRAITMGEPELENQRSEDNGLVNWSTFDIDLDELFSLNSGNDKAFFFTIAADTNSSPENIFVDNVTILGDTVATVSAPTSLVLFPAGLLFLLLSRQKTNSLA